MSEYTVSQTRLPAAAARAQARSRAGILEVRATECVCGRVAARRFPSAGNAPVTIGLRIGSYCPFEGPVR